MTEINVKWRFRQGVTTWSARASAQVGNWTIRAEWLGVSGRAALPKGPNRVELRPAPDAPLAVKVRGVTATSLREMEGVITQMTRDFAERPELEGIADPVAPVLRRLTQIQDGPRGNEDYYPLLLKAFSRLEEAGHPEPVNALAEAMNVSKNTAKTRLRLARKAEAAPRRGRARGEN